MIYIRDDIPSKQLEFFIPFDIECILIEVNLRKSKWLLVGCYHPPSQSDEYFFHHLGCILDKVGPKYDNFLLVGDFNSEETENIFSEFLTTY